MALGCHRCCRRRLGRVISASPTQRHTFPLLASLSSLGSAEACIDDMSSTQRHIDDAPDVVELSAIGVTFSDTVQGGDARPTPAPIGYVADGGVEHYRQRIIGHSLRALRRV